VYRAPWAISRAACAFRTGVREDNAAEVGGEQLVKAQPASNPALQWICA
jgi:hypothetical protein